MTSPDEKEAVPSSKLSDNNMSSAASLDEQKKKEVEITPMMDLIAGGVAGTASVVIGHPFDTIKVRLQLSSGSGISAIGSMTPSSLYSGMLAPLSTAAMVNAIIFATFGWSSRLWDEHVPSAYSTSAPLKNFTCGSFAGLVQCTVICPMEHLKCRLQIQKSQKLSAVQQSQTKVFKGPFDLTRHILQKYGVGTLYRGWWCTCWREVPAFGMYFVIYDSCKEYILDYLTPTPTLNNNDNLPPALWRGSLSISEAMEGQHMLHGETNPDRRIGTRKEISSSSPPSSSDHYNLWISSALAGGISGSFTWAIIYPFDVIKSKIQTSPLTLKNVKDIKMKNVYKQLVKEKGGNVQKAMFRGLGVTVVRAFPVNGIIFPVYEWCVQQLSSSPSFFSNKSSTCTC